MSNLTNIVFHRLGKGEDEIMGLILISNICIYITFEKWRILCYNFYPVTPKDICLSTLLFYFKLYTEFIKRQFTSYGG